MKQSKTDIAAGIDSFPLDPTTPPMEARQADALPLGPCWQFEPKWDGFWCLAFCTAGSVELRAKSGKSLTRFFPEAAAMVAALAPSPFVLDGELVIAVNGALLLDALQMTALPPVLVAVQYDHLSGRRFRHGTKFLRWRPDKLPTQCTFEQIAQPRIAYGPGA